MVGSAPTVLAAAVAASTSRIRVGTGGVMLPNHQPLVVAEQFGVLESLFPGRIDMGLGRSVGFTNGIRRALGVEKDAAEDFSRTRSGSCSATSPAPSRTTRRCTPAPAKVCACRRSYWLSATAPSSQPHSASHW